MARTTWSAALLLVATILLVSGCASSSSSPQTTSSNSAADSTQSSESFNRSNWDLLVSEPNAHKGAGVDFVGQVFTTPERDKKGVYLQVWEDAANSENNTIVAYADPAFKVADQDYVHVTGTVKGEYKGKNQLGGDVSAVTVVADSLKVVSALAAAPPAIASLGPRRQTQAGITVAIPRVDFAATETRVLMKVTNASGADASVYDSSMRAVQKGKQYDVGFSTDYPELSSDLVSGASTSGVVVFPKMNPHAGLKLIVEVSSDNTNVGDYGTLKYTFIWP